MNAEADKLPQALKPPAYFMVGGPASGKSTTRERLLPGVAVVDRDEILQDVAVYDDRDPDVAYAGGADLVQNRFREQVATGEPFVYDSTGSSAERIGYLMKLAQEAGYRTVIIYVPCTLVEALRRNAARERQVYEHIVREKYSTIRMAFELLAERADEVRVVPPSDGSTS